MSSFIPDRDSNGYPIYRIETNPFSDKKLVDGKKLFRRKHGMSLNCPANSSTAFNFVVPYALAKINELEIINSAIGDTVDFKVYDDPSGTISGTPNLMLNQFGFDVNITEKHYKDKSDYDADAIQDMKIEITYKNNDSTARVVYMNIVYHQLVAP